MQTKKRLRILLLILALLLFMAAFMYADMTIYSLDSFRYTSGKDFFKVAALDLNIKDIYSVNCLTDDANVYYVPDYCDKNVADIVLTRDHKTVHNTLTEYGCVQVGKNDNKTYYETKDGKSFMLYKIVGENEITYRTNAIVGVTLDEIIQS